MNMQSKYITLLPLVFLFLPAFVVYIAPLGSIYQCFFPILYFCIFACFICKPFNFIKKILIITNETPLKWFFIFILLSSVSSICISILGNGSIVRTIRSIFIYFILYIIPTITYFIYIIDKYITFEKFIRAFILLIWTTLILGIIAYIGQLFDIAIINNLFDFFANWRLINPNDYYNLIGEKLSNYEAFGLPRLDCLQQEPSYYARWLFLFFPFIYSFSNIQTQIVSNKILDLIIKKTLVPLSWISVILTFSPIYLVLCIALTVLIYFNYIVYLLKKYFLKLTIFVSIILIVIVTALKFNNIDFSETYLSRIINLFTSIKSFEDFIYIESSLATRVVCFVNMFCVFQKHPFLGVGLGNLGNELLNSFINSPVPLTYEVIGRCKLAVMSNSQLTYNNSLFFEILANYGLIVGGIFYYFYYTLIRDLNIFIKMQIVTNNEILYKTIYSTKWSLIALLIVMFYSSGLVSLEVCTIFFIAIISIYKAKLNECYKERIDSINEDF